MLHVPASYFGVCFFSTAQPQDDFDRVSLSCELLGVTDLGFQVMLENVCRELNLF